MIRIQPAVKTVIIDSMGGRVYEARKMASVILERKLDTCTVRGCYSAATLPFAAGKSRYLCNEARLGFHQYHQSENFDPYCDIQQEYSKDWGFYQLQGVSKAFQEKMFSADPNDFWIPGPSELEEGGMIHGVVTLKDLLPMEEAIVFGYGDFYSPPQGNPDTSTVTDEQLKGWILGCSGVLWERNCDGFDTLGTWKNEVHRANELKESLPGGWDIESREDLLDCLYGLTQQGGHNKSFLRQAHFVGQMSKEELETFLEPYKDYPEQCNELRIAHQYYEQLGEKGILAWETTRYMFLCRSGYICGWLDEKTAWELMIPIARHVQQNFKSWEEMGRNYLIGRQYWSLKDTQATGDAVEEAFCRLTEMPSSPWNKYPWDLDLSGAYQIVPALPEAAGEDLSERDSAAEPSAPSAADAGDDSVSKTAKIIPAAFEELPPVDFSKARTLSELRAEGPVLVVPDEYAAIQAAVDASKEGDTIFVKAGRYDDPVVLSQKNGIRLVGESADSTVLHLTDPNTYQTLFIRQCRDIHVSDLTIAKFQTAPTETNCALTIHGSAFEVVRCRISNARGRGVECAQKSVGRFRQCLIESCRSDGMLVLDEKTEVSIADSCFRDNTGNGICVYRQGKVAVSNSLFERNHIGVFIAETGTSATVTNCRVREDADRGILVQKGANVRVEDTLLESNKNVGFHAADKGAFVQCVRVHSRHNGYEAFSLSSDAVLESCIAEDNGASGICIKDGAKLNVRGCLSKDNKGSGIILLRQVTSAVITDCLCSNNKETGITVAGKGSHVEIKTSTCSGNGKSGIRVYDGASAKLQDNLCQDNQQNGIDVYHNKATAVLKNNRCLKNQVSGIGFSGSGTGTVEDCVCNNNKQNGIEVFEKGSQAEVKNSDCSENNGTGIQIRRMASAVVKGSRGNRNRGDGIVFTDGAAGAAENCLFEGNNQSGIEVYGDAAHVAVTNNRCLGNFYNGIVVSNGAGADMNVTGNICNANYPSGILILKRAFCPLNRNTCQYNPWAGMAIKGEGTNPSVSGNEFSDNGTWGIRIWESAEPNLGENTTDNNGKDDVLWADVQQINCQ
ncbi:MAG: right-handed parallel beta-helix repeat-containing protein [Planctomycetales bacterium]|nr:right-handed parallel beta-helix repeat-containing protein [Planctomycetales bacterium]